MDESPGPKGVTPARHLAGACLLMLAVSSLVFAARLPMRSVDAIELPFLDGIKTHVVVAFAGFPGCGDICPAGMTVLGRVASELPADNRESVSLLFINLQYGTPPQQTANYAEAFSPAILSYNVSFDDTDVLYQGLALRTFDADDSPISHSGNFYVFVRNGEGWRIEHVYRRMPSATDLANRLARLSPDHSESV